MKEKKSLQSGEVWDSIRNRLHRYKDVVAAVGHSEYGSLNVRLYRASPPQIRSFLLANEVIERVLRGQILSTVISANDLRAKNLSETRSILQKLATSWADNIEVRFEKHRSGDWFKIGFRAFMPPP